PREQVALRREAGAPAGDPGGDLSRLPEDAEVPGGGVPAEGPDPRRRPLGPARRQGGLRLPDPPPHHDGSGRGGDPPDRPPGAALDPGREAKDRKGGPPALHGQAEEGAKNLLHGAGGPPRRRPPRALESEREAPGLVQAPPEDRLRGEADRGVPR